ncbi:Trans-enoyl reductase [Colletotrichum siamense]|nr:Trans-enoyl reductase [Colletotrichum siamense]
MGSAYTGEANGSLPTTQVAVVGLENGTNGLKAGIHLPALEEDMIMVKNAAVGLNHVDNKMGASLGAIAGMDFAGRVVAMGPTARASMPAIQEGDRVCGVVLGMHPTSPLVGAFAQYTGASDTGVLKLPEHISMEQGASLASGLGTVGLALFHSLQINGYPLEEVQGKPRHVLIYGGSSAVGTLAIQLVKLAGLKPITTCSPRNFDLVTSYGAEKAFDYRSPTCAADIKLYTKNSLKYVLDCISEPETMEFCYGVIGRLGGRYTALEPWPRGLDNRGNVTADWVLGPTMIGKPIAWKPPFDKAVDPAIKKFGARFFRTAQLLLDKGLLKAHPLHILDGGLRSVLEGMDLLKSKTISGKKIVCRLD